MKKLLFIFSFIFTIHVNANCLKDIFSVGVGATSSEFELEESVGKSSINSNYGLNVLGQWVLFCPKRKLEVLNEIELRNYKFEATSSMDESVLLFNVKSTIAYLYRPRLEALFKISLEEDLYFKRNIETGQLVNSDDYSLNLLVGAKFDAIKIKKSNIYLRLLAGPRFSFSDYSKGVGRIFEIGAGTIYKIAKFRSLSLNLYYKNIYEKMDSLKQNNKDLTFNTVFLVKF
ncbi:hypothetical protein A9Q84_00090 [Halobacteriovorax marinus]|uniref:Outer membrane protein beta-barrel domain-containing protein n=1 Tax=Halobacteriovorax marinus TaxID=97084 RepID=A0A1Y5FDD7_9BACT|nr:hypothetical protein A9Q84_00090 [Halobacteriovorax marinus]